MKKIILIIAGISVLGLSNNLQAQDDSKESDKCVGKGKIIVDAFYGYPYMVGKYVQQIVSESGSGNIDVKNLNHIGGRFEYMINKTIGLGFEYTYASVTASYIESRSMYNNGTGQYYYENYNYTVGFNKHRALAKINIHFATSKFLDPYATGGVGYKVSNVYSNNLDDQQAVSEVNSVLNIIPVSFRLGIGLRYYFIKNMGIGVEAGVGGPLIQAGISGKF